MNKLMSSSMFGLAPIAPSQTLVSNDEERPKGESDEISPTGDEITRIREELDAPGAGRTKHAHWCSVLLRATWRRIHQTPILERD